MKKIAARLGRGRSDGEKARLAARLGEEADSLIACADYDSASQDCKNCRAIASRRKRTMWGILKSIKTGQVILPGTKGRM